MAISQETRDRNGELPGGVTLELPIEKLATGALLANLMHYKDPNDVFVELIKTGFRFHEQFPHETEFQVVHPNGQTENSRDLLKTMNQPNSTQQLTPITIQIPEKIARMFDERVYHYEITFQKAAISFLDEGMIIQKALLTGEKVLLSNGQDTGYNFLSLRDESILVIRKILHL